MLRAAQAAYQTDQTHEMIFDENQISAICATAAAKLMTASWRLPGFTQNPSFRYEEWCRSLPDINPVYAMSVEHHYEVAIHAEAKVFPYEVLRTKAPNQSKEEWDYQCGLYVPYTRSTWTRALNKTKVISNKQNYSITGWDAEQEKYFYEDYPRWHSLEAFFFDTVREAKINYPNQLLVVEPLHIPTKLDETGKVVADQSVEVEPVAKIVKERDVIHYWENTLAVVANGTTEYDGRQWPVFRAYDQNKIYRVEPSGEDSDGRVTYSAMEVYAHDWGYVPCRKLGGKPKDVDGEVFYESVFAGALPDLDEATRLSSTLSMVLHKNAYPVEVRRDQKCNHVNEGGQMCNNGYYWSPSANGNEGANLKCAGCNGSGKGPTTVFTVAENFGGGYPDKFLPIGEVLAYVAPSPDTIQPLDEQIDKKKENAFAFIFKSSEKIQQTAEGSHLEKDEYHSFLVQFSNESFDLLEFIIEAIGWYRWQDRFVKPTVSRPTTFSFREPESITDEISQSRESNMPVAYDAPLVMEAAKTRFNSDPDAINRVKACMAVNDLWSQDDKDLIPWVGKTVTQKDMVVKQRDYAFVVRAEKEHSDFYKLGPKRQKEIVYGYAEEELGKMPAQEDPFAADAMTGGV